MSQVLEKAGAGERNRTVVISLEGCCSTIELHPRRQPHRGVDANGAPTCYRTLVDTTSSAATSPYMHKRFAPINSFSENTIYSCV